MIAVIAAGISMTVGRLLYTIVFSAVTIWLVAWIWKGDGGTMSELATRLSGSSDLYGHNGRLPSASINFVTCHDGFTLRDLVSYNHKHNEANGEDGRDGTDDNRSWNCGAEGPAGDPAVAALRRRQLRNLLGTLLLATGVPMLVAGDEMGRTQGGNNNAYCQDNETSWVDWSLLEDPGPRDLRDLAARLIALRRRHPVLRRGGFFSGRAAAPGGLRDVAWFAPGGQEMADADWFAASATLGMFLSGRDIPQRDARGARIRDDSFLLLAHAGHLPVEFTLPGPPWAHRYAALLDTAHEQAWVAGAPAVPAGQAVLHVWQPYLKGPSNEVARTVTAPAQGEGRETFVVDVRPPPPPMVMH